VGHIDAQRIAPFGDDVAVADDQAGRVAAVLDRADRVAKRLAAEGLVMVQHEVARRLAFAGDGEVDRLLQDLRIHADFGGRLVLPAVGVRVVGLRGGQRRPGHDEQDQQREATEIHDVSFLRRFPVGAGYQP
jgi:hypothetical protein